jgi:hypothetical protein
MNINLIYSVIILFTISIIIIINSSDISAIVSDLFVNQILFNEINTTMNNNTEIKNSTSSKTCIMPECPSGKVCVQVCPESLPPI